jgi:hypothetical protein
MAGRMTNATRYLSAAAYLSPSYAGTVIRELVNSHRSVAPSVGIDLGPIVRHCLRARKIQLTRDAVLAFLLLISLIVDPELTITVIFVAFFVGFLPSVNWARKSLGIKIFAAVGSGVLLLNFLAGLVLIVIVGTIRHALQGLGSPDQGLPGPASATASSGIGLIGPLLLAAMFLTEVIYTYIRSRTLCDQLGPDAPVRRSHPSSALVESRIARIEAAQYGNLVLYSGRNPFIGTGTRTRVWSIAIELKRAANASGPVRGPVRSQGYAAIDPVALHQVIRDRLLRLKDDELPPNERLAAMTVHDHIVGLGQHRWDSPLIDSALSMPFSQASAEAVAALIRHPQAGVRYYQRVSVCDEGQAVWSGREKIMDGTDQGIAASAFIYVAVEGRMLYLEFVSSVLPPVDSRWRIVDVLPRISAGSFWIKVVLDAFSTIFRALIFAPARLFRSLASIIREGRTYQGEAEKARDYLYGDIGARVSVREMGARDLGTYIQKLDVEKYTKLTERLVTDTAFDFLRAEGVDTSAYVSSAGTVNNSSVVVQGGSFSGPVAFGAFGTAEQHNQAQPVQG